MNKQSFITILLTMLMSMTGAKTFAHDIEVANNDGVTIYYKWANNNTELVVSYRDSYYYKSDTYTGNVVIPEFVEYNGNTYPVTSIGVEAFCNCYGLTSVTIPNSVTSIGYRAFYYCSGLTSVTIPNSVTSIGGSAFYKCSSLTSVKVLITDFSAFCNNKVNNFVRTEIGKPIQLIDNEGTEITEYIVPNDVTSIGDYTFCYCNGLTSVTIPNSVTSIGENAFSGCSGLTSVTIGNSVTSIGSSAFSGCSGLTSFTIPNSVTSIGSSTFSGCSGLASFTIPNSVTSIGSSAFYGCSSLVSFTIPNSVTSIGSEAFNNCSGLTSVIIGSGVLSIGDYAFYGTNLTKTIWLTNTPPSGYNNAKGTVNYVSNDQFGISNKVVYKFLSSHFVVDGIRYVPVSPSDRTCDAIDCTNDASVEIINIGETITNKGVTLTVKKVNPYTCYQNKHIKDLKLGLSGEIGDFSFYGCSNVETAELGQNVTSIGGSAFSGCSKLKSIVIPDAVNTIGSYAFQNCSDMTSAKIGNGVVTIGESAFSGCSSLSAITIPQSVTNIGNYVFSNCTNLAKVTIADSEITLTLGSNGSNPIFSYCPLDYVYIGRDISYQTSSWYGYSPFYRNTSLRAVKITDKETEISENEFYGCTNLQQVEIGDGVTTIGKWAFSGCSSLKYFAFGTQVANIGQEAFSDCTAIEEIISKAQAAPACGSQALDDINKWECKLYVPDGCMAIYEAADQWMDFFFKEEGEGTLPQNADNPDNPDDSKKCETPTITVDGGSVKFDCKTSGVIFHYTISSSDAKSDITNSGIEVKNNYTISVYATKDGYADSEVAKKSFQVAGVGKKGDVNGDNKVDVADHVELSRIILEQGQ